ncbi:tRNA (cytidine/uridine-2'-O-)-methyltransferase [Malonomonas rubra DSM 5091]|uniref:Putative tRNA (cytidine(34)-2'-O)-methyltransferase n=2 Tax=Malonomonas rubra TaxID=57040 RepID=A0A1M6D9L7_MALRU|nr:tRNA (cytidine(34)-2'-O)-methyltransferase [Malonomonas rubra]SHI69913.1 tRNA (cytidine/uridine-2'-O-)-methyltransferase [Malonomonas rubra DSM 5091]
MLSSPAMQTNKPFHIVLIEPEIPPNTGNIGRLCAATGSHMHLVGKLGFSIDDKQVRRAGLDYWPYVKLHCWDSLEQLQTEYPDGRYWYMSKKAERNYTQVEFEEGDFLVFGKETLGLPEELLDQVGNQALRIPIFTPHVRSLNLANSAAIILFEALRQTGQLEE